MIVISESTQPVSDDLYFEIVICKEISSPRAASDTVTGTKFYTLRNSNGESLWKFTLYGTFTVNPGVSSVCTASSYSHQIYDNAWSLSSASASRSGSNAIGNAEFIKKLLLITVNRETIQVTLTCDASGNLS